MPYQVAVCGPGECTPDEESAAHTVGRLLAERGAVVICGGGSGVMAAAAAGARAGGGPAIGVWPGATREGAAPGLSAVLVTGMGQARNAIVAASADAVVVIGGSWGTLSEIALARRREDAAVPVVSLGGWRVVDRDGRELPGIDHAPTPEAAVERALRGR
ncbi:SLOG cluster 4 domain-containing protein [Streptomyces specialis]|uniref:SLOG cluster 4 domain-containing protein n=1 Tax=Streptomyces specialis TaxID=498367 RepID=UPI00099ECF89|nr:LOG family protein [Streptomyces specialis]